MHGKDGHAWIDHKRVEPTFPSFNEKYHEKKYYG